MDQTKNSEIWDALYKAWESGTGVGISYPTEALVIFLSNLAKGQGVAEYFDDLGSEKSSKRRGGGNAVEIGFGSVANLKLLREFDFFTSGVEVSLEAVERGRKALQSEADRRFREIELSIWNPINPLPFPRQSIDLVVGLQCVYYNLDFNHFLREVHRVLRPGGRLLMSFFTPRHDYLRYSEPVSAGLIQFSQDHPNPRLRGLTLLSPGSKEDLDNLFQSRFRDISIFTTESDQTPIFESWWYVDARR